MTQLTYLLCISRATGAIDLHGFNVDCKTDPDLNNRERAEVSAAVGKRFAILNAMTVGKQTPRWDAPVRLPAATRVH
jgi:hypothetical protein